MDDLKLIRSEPIPMMMKPHRVLLVEDESLVLMLLEDMLSDMGHSIAGSAAEFDKAIDLAKTIDYDFAIIDLNLKGLRTFAVAEIVQDRGIPMIFSTGYDESAIDSRFADVPVLNKPFDDRSLARAMAALG